MATPAGPAGSAEPRSLADDLRGRPDAELVALLRERPDAAAPLPPDLGSLAARLGMRAGAQRAVDRLDTAALQVLEVLVLLPEPVTAADVSRCWGAPADAQLERLRRSGLLWGTSARLRVVRAVRDSLGSHPAGLGPPLADALGRRSPARIAALVEDLGLPASGDPDVALLRLAEHLGEPAVVQALLDQAPAEARAVLDRLAWGPPVGRIEAADRTVRAAEVDTPVDWLLAHGLLAVADPGHVVLPREIALGLRGGRYHRAPEPTPPPLQVSETPEERVNDAATAAAAETVRLIEELGEEWAQAPPPVRRAGGVAMRDLRRTAAALDVPEAHAVLLAEVARAAGLLADDGQAYPFWLPTEEFDTWRAAGTAAQWARLATAWLAAPRAPGLVEGRADGGAAPVPLGPELTRPAARTVRGQVLALLAEAVEDAPSGVRPAVDIESLIDRIDWLSPRLAGQSRDEMLRWALREAAWLGITGAGALGSAAGMLLGASGRQGEWAAAAELDRLLPPPVTRLLLQADLTAVAPGRLPAELDRELALMADVESRGAATVFRFGPDSLRRAMDAGRSADEVLAVLAEHSATGEVPQPLRYLVQDAERRHGLVRVGAAGAYLRCDDEATLAELLADRRTAPLGLRRLAPTVLAAEAAPETVLRVLRELGLAPAVESADGALLIRRPPPRRAHRDGLHAEPVTSGDADLLGAVLAMRAPDGEAGSSIGAEAWPEPADGDPPQVTTDPTEVIASARAAIAGRRPLWIAHVDASGATSRLLVQPLSVEAGLISALDVASSRVRTISVHRVSAVAEYIG